MKKDQDVLKKDQDVLKNEKENKEDYDNRRTVMRTEHQQEHDVIRDDITKAKEGNKMEFNEIKKEIKALKDMMTKLLKTTEDHQKDHDENVKLNTELLNAKADQLKNENEIEIIKLKKELMIAQEVQERIPKMEEEVIGLNSEVLELKQHRQTDQIVNRELRSKLMKANEQLATCSINERS